MTQQEIQSALDKMFENPKSRNFINHLVRSYLPVTRVEKVLDKPTGPFKCAISGVELVSVQEIMEGMETDQYKKDFLAHIATMFEENSQVESPMKKLVGEKKLGVTGADTTTYLSYPAFQVLYSWILNKSLSGDKHINWLLGDARKALFAKKTEAKQQVDNFKKPAKVTTFSLGESNDVLAQLKAKLEKNEN